MSHFDAAVTYRATRKAALIYAGGLRACAYLKSRQARTILAADVNAEAAPHVRRLARRLQISELEAGKLAMDLAEEMVAA